jgi:(3R)-3-hydroxyacyl-CoA dehydrogenase / 3a,7a,12a-trihydroxy-5b-cholest-24-enoyl-CoA hydratase / enoyl-CoA hydratase 2
MEAKTLKSDEVFFLMKNYLSTGEGKDLIKKVGGIFQIDVLDKKGGKVVKQWTIDLKNGQGAVTEGPCDKYNALFSVSDEDFYQICTGKLNPQMAFIQGKMKIKGSMSLASKFTPDLFPKPTEENIKKYTKAKL